MVYCLKMLFTTVSYRQKRLSCMAKTIVTVFNVIREMSVKLPTFSISKCNVHFFNSSTRFVENLLRINLALGSI